LVILKICSKDQSVKLVRMSRFITWQPMWDSW